MMTENKALPKILFVTAHCPYGQVYGARLRTLNIARMLGDICEVGMVLFPFAPLPDEEIGETRREFNLRGVFYFEEGGAKSLGARLKRELDPYSGDTEGRRLSEGDLEVFEKLADEYDVIWFQGISIPNSLGRRNWPNAILDIDDVPSQFYRGKAREAGSSWERLMAARKSQLWSRREKVLLERFGIVGVCSEQDRKYLGGGERVHVIPNGFDGGEKLFARERTEPPRIGFIGTLQYGPNRDGVEWFMKEVWPLVLPEYPDARLRLVGAATDEGIAGKGENVDGLGFVDDAQREIASWALMIVPILVGGGTRIKIAEAFSRGCPVVSTTMGAYGYALENGRECLMADTPVEMAEACMRLLGDPESGEAMAERAWKEFRKKWSWDAIAPKISGAVAACMEHACPQEAGMAD